MNCSEIVYERKMTGSFMKLKCEGVKELDEKILLRNNLAGFLSMEKCYVNSGGQYWYNISGMQSLEMICQYNDIKLDFLEKLIVAICSKLEILENHLIDTACLILEPQLIYVSNQDGDIYFTAYPAEMKTAFGTFQQLMEYMLTKLDHSDAEAVHIAYGIYEKTLNGNYSIADIRNAIIDARKEKTKETPIEEIASSIATEEILYQKDEEDDDHEAAEIGLVEKLINKFEEYFDIKLPRRNTKQTDKVCRFRTGTKPTDKVGRFGKDTKQTDKVGHLRTSEKQPDKVCGLRTSVKQPDKEDCDRNSEQRHKGIELNHDKTKSSKADDTSENKKSALKKIFSNGRNNIRNEVTDDFKEHNRGCFFRDKEKNIKQYESNEECLIVTPNDRHYEMERQIHPTVCLSDYREHPQGMLLYEGYEKFGNIIIEKESISIGQGDEADAVIDKDTISHFHAVINQENKEYYLEDLNSTNGTYLNDEVLAYKEKRQLKINDIIQFADVKYRFV